MRDKLEGGRDGLWNYDEDTSKFGIGRHGTNSSLHAMFQFRLLSPSKESTKIGHRERERASERARGGFFCVVCEQCEAAHPVTILVHFLFRPLCFPLNFSVEFRHSSQRGNKAWRPRFARRREERKSEEEEGAIVTNLTRPPAAASSPHPQTCSWGYTLQKSNRCR